MLIRLVSEEDKNRWLELSCEVSYEVVKSLTKDVNTFWQGFNDYMDRKIAQHEALIAVNRVTQQCLGIIAFSRANNSITFLGVAKQADNLSVGEQLLLTALNQLDKMREISAKVLKSDFQATRSELLSIKN